MSLGNTYCSLVRGMGGNSMSGEEKGVCIGGYSESGGKVRLGENCESSWVEIGEQLIFFFNI